MSGAGKGDTYRKVDKNKFDAAYESVFGKKDELEYHKGQKFTTNPEISSDQKQFSL